MGLARVSLLLGPALLATAIRAQSPSLSPDLLDFYKNLHAHPELSHFEEHTSAMLAAELRNAGYTVTEHVGKYPDGSQAYGVVAILKNGPGPTLLVRADMDALPIVEETGVPYASHVLVHNKSGQEVGVMHACGHDVHTTVLIGTARAMAASRDKWHGTLMLIGQPSEETIDGAKAMLADNLYQRFGKPDLVIGLHDTNELPAGQVGLISGTGPGQLHLHRRRHPRHRRPRLRSAGRPRSHHPRRALHHADPDHRQPRRGSPGSRLSSLSATSTAARSATSSPMR